MDQESVHFFQSSKKMDPNKAKWEEPPTTSIKYFVQPRDLLIWVSKGLNILPMLLNLLIFKDIRNENPLAYIEYFIETFTICLIKDGYYYLMWFLTSLIERAYE